jgi:hypothetical protein
MHPTFHAAAAILLHFDGYASIRAEAGIAISFVNAPLFCMKSPIVVS